MARTDTEAKVEALEKQISSASAEAKAKLQKRIDELKADRAVGFAKLKRAWALTTFLIDPSHLT